MTNEEIINEALDEIEKSLKDIKGIISHQRRLVFCLSSGSVALIEECLKKLNVFKPGYKLNHLWFKKKKENAKKLISKTITCEIDSIKNIDSLLDISYQIERERNDIVYGGKVSEEVLKEKIELFLKLKKEAENV